jgi:hypothetical protein
MITSKRRAARPQIIVDERPLSSLQIRRLLQYSLEEFATDPQQQRADRSDYHKGDDKVHRSPSDSESHLEYDVGNHDSAYANKHMLASASQ